MTAIYTVLVEGDDMNDPVADAARSVLDGHLVLSRELAAQNHYPAIDVLESVSRLSHDLLSIEDRELMGSARENMAVYRKSRDLVSIGAYQAGQHGLEVHFADLVFESRAGRDAQGNADGVGKGSTLYGVRFSTWGHGIQWENSGAAFLAFEWYLRKLRDGASETSVSYTHEMSEKSKSSGEMHPRDE